MLDPFIAQENKRNLGAEALGVYFDSMTREIESYIYGTKEGPAFEMDFMFDAMSTIAWENVLKIIGVSQTPFQPIGKVQSTIHEKKKLRSIGRIVRDVMDAQLKVGQKVFLRTDVTCSYKTMLQFSQGNWYPGLERGLTRQDKIVIDDELRIAQYFSPNPEYIFHVQFFYPDALYFSYRVENGEVQGPDKHLAFVASIVDKLEKKNIIPRHPQYNEHRRTGINFQMTIVDGPNGPEVFSATAFGLQDGRVFKDSI